MRRTRLVGIIAIVFFLTACTSDLPEVPKFEFCYFTADTQEGPKNFCRSFYEISKEKCDEWNGQISTKEDCTDITGGQ